MKIKYQSEICNERHIRSVVISFNASLIITSSMPFSSTQYNIACPSLGPLGETTQHWAERGIDLRSGYTRLICTLPFLDRLLEYSLLYLEFWKFRCRMHIKHNFDFLIQTHVAVRQDVKHHAVALACTLRRHELQIMNNCSLLIANLFYCVNVRFNWNLCSIEEEK